jgi:sialate O-acetylesterase
MVTFPSMPHGGPYQLNIGWLGSGQSNMEWVVKNSNHAAEEISAGNYDKFRLFPVKTQLSYTPKDDFTAGPWEICSSRTVGDFSAVALADAGTRQKICPGKSTYRT